MRVDNDGEGGILALMTLLGVKVRKRPFIVALGLMGASLIYGDGAITPAISVLSALEGLELALPGFEHYILPCAVGILVWLFAIQPKGTAHIGRLFGPVMALWFATLAILGLLGVMKNPEVLLAINPYYGFNYLIHDGAKGFLILGGVFLCVTGAEALYADMGHFGAKPIRLGWFSFVFPSLLLNYAGQAALVLGGVAASENIFFRLCPEMLMIPLVILATAATIIASQAMITGAFSMTRQAIQLGWMPRLEIKQTSAEGFGQIYIGTINWMLMVVTLALAIIFQKSENLAAAYGIAVSITMLATTILLYVSMREIWKWSLLKASAVATVFLLVDTFFFLSNGTKFFDGGYIPVLMAVVIYGAMTIWHRGVEVVTANLAETVIPVDQFMSMLEEKNIARVPGTAVFLTRTESGTPPVMGWHVKHSRALHERLFVLKVVTESVPWVKNSSRVSVEEVAPHFWRAVARYGFMERPNIPVLLKQSRKLGCTIGLDDVTYYIGHETVLACDNKKGMPYWMELVFVAMQRNSSHVTEYFSLPTDDVVEIGRLIVI
jgi:KUP system potassium uptake protein